jgi:hypothetical protein
MVATLEQVVIINHLNMGHHHKAASDLNHQDRQFLRDRDQV